MRITYGKAQIGTSGGRPHIRKGKNQRWTKIHSDACPPIPSFLFIARSFVAREEINWSIEIQFYLRRRREASHTQIFSDNKPRVALSSITITFSMISFITKGKGTRSIIYCSSVSSLFLPTKSWIWHERLYSLSLFLSPPAETFHSAIQFLVSIFLFFSPSFFPRLLIAEQWNRGTYSSFLGSPLSLLSSGRELYRECLQGLSSHPSQWFTYAVVPLSPCLYPTLASFGPGIPRRDRKTYPRSPFLTFLRRSINNSKKERRKGFSRRSI